MLATFEKAFGPRYSRGAWYQASGYSVITPRSFALNLKVERTVRLMAASESLKLPDFDFRARRDDTTDSEQHGQPQECGLHHEHENHP